MKNSGNTKQQRTRNINYFLHEVTTMKIQTTRPPGLNSKTTGFTAALALLASLLPGTASATTAANADITDTATLNYDDTGCTAQAPISASVNITVNLVTAHPTLSAPIDATTSSGVLLDYTYTITNNSNGPDIYTLTAAAVLGAGVTSQANVFRDAGDTADITTMTLGATSATAAAIVGATTISVPNDGTADASQNGIIVGDTIVIGTNILLVSAVSDTGAGIDTITFATTPLTAAVAIGAQVGEQGTFLSRTTPIATVNNSTYVIPITANDGVTAGAAPTDPTTTTVLVINLTVTKYVANGTAPVVGGTPFPAVGKLDTSLGAGGIIYYATGVTGNPGDVLEYAIVISNGPSAATATDIIITDPIPNFTTLTSNIAVDNGVGGGFVATGKVAEDGDFAEANATTVFI